MINNVWGKIAPFWPLRNLVACNPFWGYINQPFEDVIKKHANLFRIKNLPESLEETNLHSMKYLQIFFDGSQAIIQMPNKNQGLLKSCRNLLVFDSKIVKTKEQQSFIQQLPENSQNVITHCLDFLCVPENERENFLMLMLASLSGWASVVKHKAEWDDKNETLQHDFLALRIIIFCLVSKDWQQVCNLINVPENESDFLQICEYEAKYRKELLDMLSFEKSEKSQPKNLSVNNFNANNFRSFEDEERTLYNINEHRRQETTTKYEAENYLRMGSKPINKTGINLNNISTNFNPFFGI